MNAAEQDDRISYERTAYLMQTARVRGVSIARVVMDDIRWAIQDGVDLDPCEEY